MTTAAVTACLVTRGNVDMQPVLDSLPDEWERVIYNNGAGSCLVDTPGEHLGGLIYPLPDLAVYGRYAAIEHASHDLIYVQDDDCVVSDPQAIVDTWAVSAWHPNGRAAVVCNMPQEFRPHYEGADALVGFGAAFHRAAPERAFARIGFDGFVSPFLDDDHTQIRYTNAAGVTVEFPDTAFVRRTCDIVFTGLTPSVLVDVSHTDRKFASDYDRMWRQPGHVEERQRMRDLVAKVRDAG